VLGSLADGYNGEGSGLARAAIDDALTFFPLGAVAGAAVKFGRMVKAARVTKGTKKFSPRVEKASDSIQDFLGEGATLKRNKAGDPIFVNKDNTKRVRFDAKNPHGDKPHGHVEIKKGKRWKDATSEHRIYLKDE